MDEKQQKIRAALAGIWQSSRPAMLDRLAVLTRAAEALRAGGIEAALRDEASGAAHKLAGSLGTFGFNEGSELARQLERELEAGASDAQAFGAALDQLRALIDRALP